MNESKDILDGFNAGYILQQKRPKVFKQLKEALSEVNLPFFDAFVEGGKVYTEERLKSLMLGKGIENPSQESPIKDQSDVDMDV